MAEQEQQAKSVLSSMKHASEVLYITLLIASEDMLT